MVYEKLIANCHVIFHEIKNIHKIFGPDLMGVMGMTVRQKLEETIRDCTDIAQDFIWLYKYVTLVAGMVFINWIPFLVTFSHGISLATIEFIFEKESS